MIRSAVSTSASSTTSGGASRSALFPAPSSSRPLRNARSTSACGTSGAGSRVPRSFTNSMPIMRPRPRTSPIEPYFSCSRLAPASNRSPSRGTRGRSSCSTTSSVASAAAQHTGLPPKVLPCAPGCHFMIDSLAMFAPIGMPLPPALGAEQDVGLDPLVLRRPHLAGASHAALHLVAHQQDAVAVAQLAQRLHIAGRRHDVAAFPLDRLHENRGRALRVEPLGEQVVLDGRHAAHRTGGLAAAEVAACRPSRTTCSP